MRINGVISKEAYVAEYVRMVIKILDLEGDFAEDYKRMAEIHLDKIKELVDHINNKGN